MGGAAGGAEIDAGTAAQVLEEAGSFAECGLPMCAVRCGASEGF